MASISNRVYTPQDPISHRGKTAVGSVATVPPSLLPSSPPPSFSFFSSRNPNTFGAWLADRNVRRTDSAKIRETWVHSLEKRAGSSPGELEDLSERVPRAYSCLPTRKIRDAGYLHRAGAFPVSVRLERFHANGNEEVALSTAT